MKMKKPKYYFYKNNPSDKVTWVYISGRENALAFTFDKKRIYFLFGDYLDNLTPEEKEIFDKENPFWADFFKHTK